MDKRDVDLRNKSIELKKLQEEFDNIKNPLGW